MKALRVILLLTAAAWLPHAAKAQTPANNEAWVRQTDLASGIVYDMPVTGVGTSNYTAPMPVPESGAKFELFAKGTAWDSKIYHLDTKLIHAFSPAATMELHSEDSYVRGDPATGSYVIRTRADKPFSYTIMVDGLIEESADLHENSVGFGVRGKNYDPETYAVRLKKDPATGEVIIDPATGQPMEEDPYPLGDYNLQNGPVPEVNGLHNLNEGGITAACGEQTYIFKRYEGDGVPETIIAQPKVEVWPVSVVKVDGITEGQVFTDRIPPIPLTMNHLYPDSKTYVQIYPGSHAVGTVGTVIDGTERLYGRYYLPGQVEEPTNVPQNVSHSIQDLSQYAAADGVYTLEVITETPFENRTPELLYHVTFEVDRVISSRGQLSTTEKPAAAVPVTP